jgi:hypothetical protein
VCAAGVGLLYLQAQTNDVFFYFADGEVGVTATTDVDDIDNTAKVTAGNAIAFANTYAAQLDATTKAPLKIRINRAQDRFLVVKAASTAGGMVIHRYDARDPSGRPTKHLGGLLGAPLQKAWDKTEKAVRQQRTKAS